jgi:cullin-4
MSKALGKRPEIVELAKPTRSAFQPNHGARKLVIKNLRTASRARDLEQYYEKTRNELADALQAIFEQQPPRQPFERLYRGVEDICRHGAARELFDVLRARCESYLNGPLLRSIMVDSGSSNIDMLTAVYKHWVIWNSQSVGVLETVRRVDVNKTPRLQFVPFSAISTVHSCSIIMTSLRLTIWQ